MRKRVIRIIYTLQKISNLINISKCSTDKGKVFCPCCNKKILQTEFTKHVSKCHKFHKEGTFIKLPEVCANQPLPYMTFTNHKNKLERPFMFYTDTESTLKKTDDGKKIHEHIVNSCCFYFVCTFDTSRNELFTYEGTNCLKEMTQKMFELSELCINEMKHNEKKWL